MHNKNDVVYFREVVVGSIYCAQQKRCCRFPGSSCRVYNATNIVHNKTNVVHFREVVVGSMMRPASSQQKQCRAFQGSSCRVYDATSIVHNNIVHSREVVV